jgi:hypothetical protein
MKDVVLEFHQIIFQVRLKCVQMYTSVIQHFGKDRAGSFIKGFAPKLTENSNTTSFIGYINNAVIKLQIYINLHTCIVWQSKDIIPMWFDVFIQDRCAHKLKCLLCFFTVMFMNKILKITIYRLSTLCDKVCIIVTCGRSVIF